MRIIQMSIITSGNTRPVNADFFIYTHSDLINPRVRSERGGCLLVGIDSTGFFLCQNIPGGFMPKQVIPFPERVHVLPAELQARFSVLEMAVCAAITQLIQPPISEVDFSYVMGLRTAFEEFRDKLYADYAIERITVSKDQLWSNRNN